MKRIWLRGGFPRSYLAGSDAPRVSRSMRTAMTDLELEHLWIVCPTRKGYPVEERITVAALDELPRISSWRPTRGGTG